MTRSGARRAALHQGDPWAARLGAGSAAVRSPPPTVLRLLKESIPNHPIHPRHIHVALHLLCYLSVDPAARPAISPHRQETQIPRCRQPGRKRSRLALRAAADADLQASAGLLINALKEKLDPMQGNEIAPIRRPEVIWRKMGEETVLLNSRTEDYFSLNEVGTRVWELIDGQATPRDIAAKIAEEYEVEPREVEADVEALLQELRQHELVT